MNSNLHDLPPGRVIAFDWGAARIGVAASDLSRTLASPRPAIAEKDKGAQIRRAVATALELDAALVLVGLPLHLDGTPGSSARSATLFADKLRAGLEAAARLDAARMDSVSPGVVLVDERFTSATAERQLMETRRPGRLRKDGTLDSASAAVLLQAWLDGARSEEVR